MDLNYRTFGEGEPVIILHGLFGMLDNWQTIAKKLADDYQVILVDLPNHGRSPHTDTFSYPDMAEALAEFIDLEGINAPHLIGHSMGGKVALQFAVDYPDVAKSLIVVDMGMRKYTPHHRVILESLERLDIHTVEKRSDADEALAMRIPEPGVRLFLMKNLTRQKEGGYTWKMNLPLILENYDNILQEVLPEDVIDTPALFIRGAKSKYIRDEDWPAIEQHFRTVGLETIDAGHWVHAERPDELLGYVQNWLYST